MLWINIIPNANHRIIQIFLFKIEGTFTLEEVYLWSFLDSIEWNEASKATNIYSPRNTFVLTIWLTY